MLNTTIAVIGGGAIYLKIVINPFSAMKRVTFWRCEIHLPKSGAGKVVKTR